MSHWFSPKRVGKVLLKVGAPKQFEFSRRDIVIDTDKGAIYFKDKRGTLKKVFSPEAANEGSETLILGNMSASQGVFGTGIFAGDVTCSGDISSSGVIIASEFRSDGDDTMRFDDSMNILGNVTSSGTGSFSGGVVTVLTGSFGYVSTTGLKVSGKVDSHLVPKTDNTYDLGSTTTRWRDIHVYSSSVRFYDNEGEIGAISFERGRGVRMRESGDVDAAETVLSASAIRTTGDIHSKGSVVAKTGSFIIIEGGVF